MEARPNPLHTRTLECPPGCLIIIADTSEGAVESEVRVLADPDLGVRGCGKLPPATGTAGRLLGVCGCGPTLKMPLPLLRRGAAAAWQRGAPPEVPAAARGPLAPKAHPATAPATRARQAQWAVLALLGTAVGFKALGLAGYAARHGLPSLPYGHDGRAKPSWYWGDWRYYRDAPREPQRVFAPSLRASLVRECLGGVPPECLDQPFPVPASAPAACFPKLAFLASYPTSGNEIVHGLYEAITGITFAVDAPWGMAPKEGGPVAWVPDRRLAEPAGPGHQHFKKPEAGDAGPSGGVRLHIHDRYCRFGRTTADGSESLLPMGRGTLMKTHFPTTGSDGRGDPVWTRRYAWRYRPSPPHFDVVGLVRLTRNPGDNLLRDAFRWDNRECQTDIDCFREQAQGACERMFDFVPRWNAFHAFWRGWHGRNKEVPHMVLHYEDVTDPARAANVMRRVVALAGEAPKEKGSVAAAVAAGVRPLDYTPGTLVRDVCGADVARRLHAATSEGASGLGYAFDDAAATWAVRRPQAEADGGDAVLPLARRRSGEGEGTDGNGQPARG